MIGTAPHGIFINTDNTIYLADPGNNRILIWYNSSINPSITIYGNLLYPSSLFVTANGDIYGDDSYLTYKINKWTSDTNTSVVAMNVSGECWGLFIDINNNLYCSMRYLHKVVTKSLNTNSNIQKIVAGTGCIGSSSNTLNEPLGIFVDNILGLYVADLRNNRIQLFLLGELAAITVAGNGSTSITITLNYPTGVVLDADNYLFIADYISNRIVGSGPNGFRCLVGCSGVASSASNTLNNPVTMVFDSYGNMYVVDQANQRIQKFILLNNTLGKCCMLIEFTVISIINI